MGINMGKKATLEERGRVLIPKDLRDELGLKTGQRLLIEKRGEEIVLKPSSDVGKFVSELRGCVAVSKLKPLDVKRIWEKL